ncbi:MAG: hypothetical protein WKF84_29395 [Pyrinomonadaceae bacterium]
MAETLSEAATICDAITGNGRVSFDAFVAFGNFIKRSLQHSSAARGLTQVYSGSTVVQLQESLQKVLDGLSSDKLSSDVRRIFVDFARLIDYLSAIEAALRADRPLKSTLGIFTLIHEEARSLQDLIDKRALRGGGGDLGSDVFDTLDSTAYAINMELRKVFGHELVGLSALRQARPSFTLKSRQAHGLLSNCFQQSTVMRSRRFLIRTLTGSSFFMRSKTGSNNQWIFAKTFGACLSSCVRPAKSATAIRHHRLRCALTRFAKGSLRYLMYKDWETYERFAEEVNKAHGAVELAPVLHRFDCYLETLLGQVRMRAVLVNQPLEFLADESLSPVNPLPNRYLACAANCEAMVPNWPKAERVFRSTPSSLKRVTVVA